MNKSLVQILALSISILSIVSCKTGKKTVLKSYPKPDTTAVSRPIDTIGKAATDTTAATQPSLSPEKKLLIDSLVPVWHQNIDYNTFNGKAKMHYEGKGQEHDLIANFRMKKDSVIWVQINASILNVLVARAYITPDSFKLINYLQKEVITMPFSRANELLPTTIEFSQLQNLIVGNALRVQGTPTDATNFGGTWSIQLEDPQYVQQLTYNKSDSTLRSSQLKTHNNSGPSAMIQYGEYALIDGRKFSNSRAINIMNGADQYYLGMSFNNAVFNQPLDYPFSIPKNYKIK